MSDACLRKRESASAATTRAWLNPRSACFCGAAEPGQPASAAGASAASCGWRRPAACPSPRAAGRSAVILEGVDQLAHAALVGSIGDSLHEGRSGRRQARQRLAGASGPAEEVGGRSRMSPQRAHMESRLGRELQTSRQHRLERKRGAGGENRRAEHEAGKRVQLTASMGLRSTRDTARHLEISDGGTSSVSERESLRKTHLAQAAVAITATTASVYLWRQIQANRRVRACAAESDVGMCAFGQKASAAQDCTANVLVVMLCVGRDVGLSLFLP